MNTLYLKKQNPLHSLVHKGQGKRYAREMILEDEIYRSYLMIELDKEIELLRRITLSDEFLAQAKLRRERRHAKQINRTKNQTLVYDKFIKKMRDKSK